ncbi:MULTISPECIES: TonB-dependent receptor [Pasteurellaceae]|uniref:TonB-dependent receptor n=1 Tax=Pasteurella atlantica TaxID=2827233 RepID=A0AAW8CJM0_9PAST|nr:TonB-dependent receptor [Pasteurella atlantica]MBR0574316.1 TonB-dependent receptor [Pasteurella atlantica]MDP8040220.1 TonB-dependent receptor [Pasteurella atlantica]MDP8042341.1 TonB-dependent receptor [Pasteurella atlantica]MDP8044534.1 TonB-dependent receptor [Pasteurella atlantica]MDP8046546.1 TonB-dependent receptor [Pasteurella atlantica]
MKKNFSLTLISLSIYLVYPPYGFTQNNSPITLNEIVVISDKLDHSSESLLGGSRSFINRESDSLNTSLQSQKAVSLGQTTEKISGVQNNSFGPNNGIPQIRSLTNSRVQINNNRLAISGLAAISGNLPTAVNPSLASEIEVHKSSASVLYGGNAIGGAVNVTTAQIPNQLTEESFKGVIEVSGGENVTSDQSFSLNGNINNFVWHIDGMNSYIDSYKTKGNPKADACYNIPNIWRLGKNGMGINSELARACQVEPIFSETHFNKKSRQYINAQYLKAIKNGSEKTYLENLGLGDDQIKDLYFQYAPNWSKKWRKKSDGKGWEQYIDPEKIVENPDYVAGEKEQIRDFLGIKDIVDIENGKISNSHMHNQNISTGLSYIVDNGYIGFGVSYYKNDYGVPGYASLTTNTDNKKINLKPVNIKSHQTVYSLEGAYIPESQYLENIKTKLTYIDSKNEEYLGKTFADSLNAKQTQLRTEINHQFNHFTSGTIGIDLSSRKIDSEGKDRFIPDTKSKKYGLFAMQNLTWKEWLTTFGYRNEIVKHQAFFGDGYTTSQGSDGSTGKYGKNLRKFNLHHYFIDTSWQPVQFLTLNGRYSYSQRAPEVNELFASNLHFATLTDERGNPLLKEETARTLEFGSKIHWQDTTFTVNYFKTNYSNYIYLGNTGISRQALEVKEWRQSDTIINGWELELNQQIELADYGNLDVRLFADLVKNKPKMKNSFQTRHDGNYMSNMPTSRYGIGLSYNKNNWKLGSTLTHYRVQKYPTNTNMEKGINLPGYNLVDAYAEYDIDLNPKNKIELFLDIRNLTNKKAHPNNSTLKYLTPIAGRSFRLGLRYIF